MATLAAAAGTDEELRALMEQRRAKRMLSNRESARRLRNRKQRHLDDLTAQAAHLRRENAHVATALGVTTQDLVVVDAEKAVLRTQAAELAARLGSLNDILACMNTNASGARPAARKAAGEGCARATGGEGRARLVRVRPSVAG